MKKYFLNRLILFLVISTANVVCHGQSTIAGLISIKNKITNTYDTNPAEINGIVKSYIPKGFILMNYLERANHNTHQIDVIHTLENNQSTNGKEKIIITTTNNSSQEDFSIVEFNTSDFTLFQQWIAFIISNGNFTERLNEHMVYTYNYGNDIVKIGTVTKSYARQDTAEISEYETKVEPLPVTYFVTIKFKLL